LRLNIDLREVEAITRARLGQLDDAIPFLRGNPRTIAGPIIGQGGVGRLRLACELEDGRERF